jgi:hypothetical protein
MAFDPQYRMSIQDINGNYYSATQNAADGTWNVTTGPTLTYLNVLPEGWADTLIQWDRDLSYLGVFRSKTNQGYKFCKDARAIIRYIRDTQGVRGYGKLVIYKIDFSATGITYPIYYPSELDFKTFDDDKLAQMLSIGTLDSGLFRDLKAYGDTKFNVPIWNNTGTDEAPIWEINGDADFVVHNGIKLLYNSTYVSSATKDNHLVFNGSLPDGLLGWNHGKHGTVPNDGWHTIPHMAQYNIVQNNGTTTYVGNDILQPFLIQGNQNSGLTTCEEHFEGTNNSQPYTRNNYSLNDQLLAGQISMFASVSGQIVGDITIGDSGTHQYLSFVLFEIGPNDVCTPDPITGEYSYIEILRIPLPDASGAFTPPSGGAFSNYDAADRTQVTLKPNKVYSFGIIWDNDAGTTNGLNITFSDLQFSLYSNYDSGVSGVPIPAPSLNPSVFPTMRLGRLLQILVPYLATKNTNGYGFPVPVATPYSGDSAFLFDPSILVKDVCPYQIHMTSAYCIHDLQGNPYISISLNQLFDFCKKALGCGAAIEYDGSSNATKFRIENLEYFFDAGTMILDLGYDVTDIHETQLMQGLGANLKLGYTKADTNTDFGVDPFCTSLFFNTPASSIPGLMDYEEDGVLCEMYAIEKIRAQRINQPVGQSYDPANPSTDNQLIAIYCNAESTVVLPNTESVVYDIQPYDPSNNPVPCIAFEPVTFPTAQSTDPAAGGAPYVFGLYYPDTAINLPLSPCRVLQRGTGKLLHSVLDLMDSENLTFRNTGVMQYNNKVVGLSGIESNLVVGSGAGNVTTEFKDVQIGSLPAQLFKSNPFSWKSTYPVNMSVILNNNPNGYIRFFEKNEGGFGYTERRMFLVKATQSAATNAATEFIGWPVPGF